MVQVTRPRLSRSAPSWAGATAGLFVAGVALLTPTASLEAFAGSSGIAAVLPVAAPPLGATARAVLALGGGLGIAAIVWAAAYLLVGPGGPLARGSGKAEDQPAIRRADAHPDAPPRWPLMAAELPAPPPSPPAPVELALPRDLDVPLAEFDPDALRPVPMEPVRAVKALAPALAPGERLETFTLSPPPPAPPVRRDEPPSIDALLRRLEQGARRRVAAAH